MELKKIPTAKGWQESATTDPATICQWFSQRPGINYGVRTGLVNNIFVIDLDGEGARAWWRELGIGDSTAMVISPRKDGGVHHYFRVYDMEVSTIKGKSYVNRNPAWHPDVDVRGEGGLVVGPGSRTEDGVYVGDLSNIPDAPQALLDLLPQKQSFTTEAPVEVQVAMGDGADAGEAWRLVPRANTASESEQTDVEHIRNNLLALPRQWHEGAGWHDTVFRSACWLWRMIRTPGYAITEGQAADLILNCTPTYPGWGVEEIVRQWESAQEITQGQYADPPADALPELPDFLDTANQLPALAPVSSRPFIDIIRDAETRPAKLIQECVAAGLTALQTITIVHNSVSGERYREGGDFGLRKLFRDVSAVTPVAIASPATAPATAQSSTGLGLLVDDAPGYVEPPVVVAEPLVQLQRAPKDISTHELTLLSQSERDSLIGDTWWGDDYLTWARSLVSAFNAPYHRMNRWMALSLIFSTVGVIPMAKGDMGLNLYAFGTGQTTTGKSESLQILNSFLRTYFSEEDDPDIGGNPSPSALSEKLIERDGKASFFNKDEAHGQIAEMKVKDYLKNLMESLTALYDGEVPKMLRTTNRDASDKRASTYFSIHYMGTHEGITDVLEASDWGSGFLPRFVWTIGEKQEITRETLRLKMRRAGQGREQDVRAMQKQWTARFRGIAMRLAPTGKPTEMDFDEVVQERILNLGERLVEHANSMPLLRERLLPSALRLRISIMKAAALVALSDGRSNVTLRDLYIAMEQGEEWLANLFTMVTATDSSPFVRMVDKVANLLRDAGGEMRMENIYRRSPSDTKHGTDNLVSQLLAEGRAKKELLPDQTTVLRLIGDTQ